MKNDNELSELELVRLSDETWQVVRVSNGQDIIIQEGFATEQEAEDFALAYLRQEQE